MAWNRPSEAPKIEQKSSPVWKHGLVALLVVVLGSLVIWLCCKPSEQNQKTHKPSERARISEVKKTSVKPKPASVEPVEPVKDKNSKKRMYRGSEVVRTEFKTNGNVVVERLYTADGKYHNLNHVPPSIFKHASDEYLGIVLSTPPGLPMAPLPDLSHDKNIEKAFLESLKDEIKINETDSDEVKDIKAKVIAARESMDAQLRQGVGFAEVLENERKIHNENVSVRSQVSAEYHNLLKTSAEAAEVYRTKVNAVLLKMGIEELEQKQKKQKVVK